jgi:hypothetical protein
MVKIVVEKPCRYYSCMNGPLSLKNMQESDIGVEKRRREIEMQEKALAVPFSRCIPIAHLHERGHRGGGE